MVEFVFEFIDKWVSHKKSEDDEDFEVIGLGNVGERNRKCSSMAGC